MLIDGSNSFIVQLSMGVKQSVQIETPKFNPAEWEPAESPPSDLPEEYGLYRTLRHIKTGEKIDQYDFLWPSEQEYLYYLKSFNWRHRQANVVNTRFIELSNHEEICSHSYMAKIYVEHVKVRISQISDIPFPDNLYVLMEALEGFSRIYQHSKYFQIEESQICVDEAGNVKVWINADLSINYPTNEGYNDHRDNGQEGMVDSIVNIIASNTDHETEPTPTFKEFFEQKRGKGKRFEEAKVMVLNYARLNDCQIPGRFEAILNMDNDEQMDLKSFTDHSRSNQQLPRREQVHYEQDDRNNNNAQYYHNYQQQQQAYPNAYQSPPIQNYSFGPRSPPFLQGPPAAAHYVQQQIYPPQPAPYYPQHQAAPVYYIPHYARIEYPMRAFNPNQIYAGQPTAIPNNYHQPQQPQQQNAQELQAMPIQSRKSNASGQRNAEQSFPNGDIKNTGISKVNIQVTAHEEDQHDGHEFPHDSAHQEAQFIEPVTSTQRNTAFSEADDLVARSLPIKAGYPSQGTQQLSSMGQSERAIYSHISQKGHNNNGDGFGLTKNSQLKLKDSAMSSQKGALTLTAVKPKAKAAPIKYFYSLEEELEIDPDIAADMAKYLA